MSLSSVVGALVLRCYIAAHVRRHGRGQDHESRIEGLLRRLRKWLVAQGDPVVTMRVGKRNIALPLSHDLPVYFALVPTYDRVLPALARRMWDQAGELMVIDVGANVGDTAALLTDAVADARLLCVEGSVTYFRLLEQNVRTLRMNAACVRAFCGEHAGVDGNVTEQAGTGSLVHGANQIATVEIRTLDDVLDTNQTFRSAALLKSDTDGYDVKVLHGAERFIRETQPVLFFEYFEELIRTAGDDPTAIFPWLAERGYIRAELFTNQGVTIGRFNLADGSIAAAARRAVAGGSVHYVDVLAWPAQWEAAFAD